jgi:DNA repair protein RadA/Sms
MAKARVVYACQQCGHKEPKWLGKCPECGEYNTLVEEVARADEGVARPVLGDERPVPITSVAPAERPRIKTGLPEVDRVLGGGLVVGSVALVGGDPGIGKSTLLLQLCQRIAGQGLTVLYASSEESVMQTKLRADRLGASSPNLYVVSETNLGVLRRWLEEMKPALAVVDSIQMIYRPEIPSAPGTVGQVRECASELTFTAKRLGISLLIVGHVTKDGAIAGPRTLEHVVDAVFYFEGDRFQSFRVLRGVKNRFGSTNEIGIFEMRGDGLAEVSNPSEMFMSEDRAHRAGSAIVPSLIGTRTLLVEVQALTQPAADGSMTMRKVSGFDANRVAIIIAVIARRLGAPVFKDHVFVNVVGGVIIEEPAADLAVATALVSASRNKPVDARTALLGELGLGGEVRGVTQASARVLEAKRLGFARAIVPKHNVQAIGSVDGIEVVPVANLREAVDQAGVW